MKDDSLPHCHRSPTRLSVVALQPLAHARKPSSLNARLVKLSYFRSRCKLSDVLTYTELWIQRSDILCKADIAHFADQAMHREVIPSMLRISSNHPYLQSSNQLHRLRSSSQPRTSFSLLTKPPFPSSPHPSIPFSKPKPSKNE